MERLEIIETLKHIPVRVDEQIRGLPDSALRFRPSESKSSIKEIVGHLKEQAEGWQKRLYMIWSQTDPFLPDFDTDAAASDGKYQEADIATLMEAYRKARLETVDLLDHAVDWTRLGQVRGTGRRTMKQLAEWLIAEESKHVQQISRLKEQAQQASRA